VCRLSFRDPRDMQVQISGAVTTKIEKWPQPLKSCGSLLWHSLPCLSRRQLGTSQRCEVFSLHWRFVESGSAAVFVMVAPCRVRNSSWMWAPPCRHSASGPHNHKRARSSFLHPTYLRRCCHHVPLVPACRSGLSSYANPLWWGHVWT
jgi:hypothetical protein